MTNPSRLISSQPAPVARARRPPTLTTLSIIVQAVAVSLAAAVPADISDDLAAIRKKHGVPSLTAVVFSADSILARGAVGERRKGSGVAVTLDDRYHIGSITKPITATLAGILVDEGTLDWSTTLGQAVGDLTKDPVVRTITLTQLLEHRAGFAANLPDRVIEGLNLDGRAAHRDRRRAAREILRSPPPESPGSRFQYSNLGYTLAGLVIESRARVPWESLVQQKLFRPLGITSAGFGAPATSARRIDQPCGHSESGEPIDPGPGADNIPAMGPAGTVHMTVPDLARFGQWHLHENGPLTPPLLKPETLQRLHGHGKPDGYQLGWDRTTRSWAGGQALTHNGSNTMFFAVLWLAPERGFGVAAAVNQGGDKADAACDDAASLAIRRYLPAPTSAALPTR